MRDYIALNGQGWRNDGQRAAIGSAEYDFTGALQLDGTATLMDCAMMPPAQQNQVVEPRAAAIHPVLDMVRITEA